MSTCIRRDRTYWTTCPCADCNQSRIRARKLHSMGRRRTITHDQAWAIVAARFDAGWTARALASACGLDHDYFSRHLARWRRGEQVYIGPSLAEAIVNMGTPTEGQIGAEPSRRRLRALATIGHGLRTIEAESGVKFSTLAAVRNNGERVGAAVATAIADTYDRLHMTPGDDEQAQRIAREKHWAAPMAWGDIDTDLRPRGVRDAEKRDLLTEWAELEAAGESIDQAATRLGVTVGAIERAMYRARKKAVA